MSSTAVLPVSLPPAGSLTLPGSTLTMTPKPKQQEALVTEVERKAINAMDNFTCNICLDKFSTVGSKKPCITSCGHTFCEECLMRGKLSKCPCCRSPIPGFYATKKPTANFSLICVIENLSTKRELLPELQYSFAQRILIEELARAQDLVRDLKLELRITERLETETEDKKKSEELNINMEKLEVSIQEAEDKVLSKRLELSNIVGKTPNYLIKAKQNVDKASKNPFAFHPQTFVPSSSFSAINCFDKMAVQFDFGSSNVPLVVADTKHNSQNTLEEIQEQSLRSSYEIERAMYDTKGAMNWKAYEKFIKEALSSEKESYEEAVEGSVTLSEDAMDVVGTSEPIVGNVSLRNKVKAKTRKGRKNNSIVPEDVLAKFDGKFVPPSAFDECISASCSNPFSWILKLF